MSELDHDFPDRTDEARAVLDRNWTGHSTIPAPGLYPHQWNWDTGFIAIGRSSYEQERAETEMVSLFTGQWADGRLPHIIFHPRVSHDAYFPGPAFWESEKVESSPRGVSTSGITQPPIHAWAAIEIYRRSANRAESLAFLALLFPKLVALHRYIRDHRNGEDGLAWILHPWESGLDNSPAWDNAFERVKVPEGALPPYERHDLKHGDKRDRPTDLDYDRFVYLAWNYKQMGYDDLRAREEAPFRVKDPMFNAIFARSAASLAEIATIIGTDGKEFAEDAAHTAHSIEQHMWKPKHERFAPIDVLTGESLNHHSIVSFMPIITPGVDGHRLDLLTKTLRGFRHCESPTCYICPSYALHEEAFDDRRYWRGPLWINTNWLLYQGCIDIGFDLGAAELRRAVIELVGAHGFREYYDPHGGAGYGAQDFSWTAALYLDLMRSPEAE